MVLSAFRHTYNWRLQSWTMSNTICTTSGDPCLAAWSRRSYPRSPQSSFHSRSSFFCSALCFCLLSSWNTFRVLRILKGMHKKQRGFSSRNQEQEFSGGLLSSSVNLWSMVLPSLYHYQLSYIQTELRNKIFQLNELTWGNCFQLPDEVEFYCFC